MISVLKYLCFLFIIKLCVLFTELYTQYRPTLIHTTNCSYSRVSPFHYEFAYYWDNNSNGTGQVSHDYATTHPSCTLLQNNSIDHHVTVSVVLTSCFESLCHDEPCADFASTVLSSRLHLFSWHYLQVSNQKRNKHVVEPRIERPGNSFDFPQVPVKRADPWALNEQENVAIWDDCVYKKMGSNVVDGSFTPKYNR